MTEKTRLQAWEPLEAPPTDDGPALQEALMRSPVVEVIAELTSSKARDVERLWLALADGTMVCVGGWGSPDYDSAGLDIWISQPEESYR